MFRNWMLQYVPVVGLGVFLIGSTALFHLEDVPDQELARLNAAYIFACGSFKPCPAACVPHSCTPTVGIGCQPAPAGTSGVVSFNSTIGSCWFGIGWCVPLMPCGKDVNPADCPAMNDDGTCPPGTCVVAATGKTAC
jgi:hypothetical protein